MDGSQEERAWLITKTRKKRGYESRQNLLDVGGMLKLFECCNPQQAQAEREYWLRAVAQTTERLHAEAEEVREAVEDARQTGEHMRAVLLNRRARKGSGG